MAERDPCGPFELWTRSTERGSFVSFEKTAKIVFLQYTAHLFIITNEISQDAGN